MKIVPQNQAERSAAEWLEAVELVRGDAVLQRAITACTILSNPARNRCTTTTWSKRQRLLNAGWTASSLREASAQNHQLNKSQCTEYYDLLYNRLDAVIRPEKMNAFSHAQSSQLTFLRVCACDVHERRLRVRPGLLMLYIYMVASPPMTRTCP